jgi:hypothetical protein
MYMCIIYLCMYDTMYVSFCVCVYKRMRICIYICMCVCTYECMYVCVMYAFILFAFPISHFAVTLTMKHLGGQDFSSGIWCVLLYFKKLSVTEIATCWQYECGALLEWWWQREIKCWVAWDQTFSSVEAGDYELKNGNILQKVFYVMHVFCSSKIKFVVSSWI